MPVVRPFKQSMEQPYSFKIQTHMSQENAVVKKSKKLWGKKRGTLILLLQFAYKNWRLSGEAGDKYCQLTSLGIFPVLALRIVFCVASRYSIYVIICFTRIKTIWQTSRMIACKFNHQHFIFTTDTSVTKCFFLNVNVLSTSLKNFLASLLRQYYAYLTDTQCKRVGTQCWVFG